MCREARGIWISKWFLRRFDNCEADNLASQVSIQRPGIQREIDDQFVCRAMNQHVRYSRSIIQADGHLAAER